MPSQDVAFLWRPSAQARRRARQNHDAGGADPRGKVSFLGSKLSRRGFAGVCPCFHLPKFHFGTGFLSHSHSVEFAQDNLNELTCTTSFEGSRAQLVQYISKSKFCSWTFILPYSLWAPLKGWEAKRGSRAGTPSWNCLFLTLSGVGLKGNQKESHQKCGPPVTGSLQAWFPHPAKNLQEKLHWALDLKDRKLRVGKCLRLNAYHLMLLEHPSTP